MSTEPAKGCCVCKRNLEYVRVPIVMGDRIFCGPGCVSIADGSIGRDIRKSRKKERRLLLMRYYLLLALGVGACVSSIIIYNGFLSGDFYFRRPISFLFMPAFGVAVSFYSIREIRKMSRRRRI